ncbi:MAG TPA: M56 family metallopeptidase [Thermoanaerobaculia bacterium]
MITVLAVKATLALLFALLIVFSLRHGRASVRHLVLGALFAFLLLLPAVQKFAPRWMIVVDEKSPAAFVQERSEFREADVEQVQQVETKLPMRVNWTRLYFTGSALMLAWLAIGVLRLHRLARNGEVWLEGTARLNEIALDADIRRSALVVLSNEVSSPMTFGFRRSTVVLPFAARRWSDNALTLALRHELEHVRREDWMLQMIARAAVALYWLHPLAWIAWRRFCLEAERACDDAVVDSCEAPDLYAGQLVALARDMRRMIAIPALGMASRSRLALRVSAILDPTQPRGRHSRAAASATLVVAFALLVSIAPVQVVAAAAAELIAPITDRSSRAGMVAEHLIETASKGDLVGVKELLESGVDVNTALRGDGTALIAAARGGHLDLITYLLEVGADVNLSVEGDGNPIIAAAESGQVDAVKMLLEAGASIDEVVPGDENALITAAASGRTDVVRLLIDEGADVNLETFADGREYRTALRMARRGGHTDIEQMLLRAGARR